MNYDTKIYRRFMQFPLFYFAILSSTLLGACNKLVHIPEPVSTITSAKVYASASDANAAAAGIYSYMAEGGTFFWPRFGNGLTTICAGGAADELAIANYSYTPYYLNEVLATDPEVVNSFWGPAYFSIYQANALIDNLKGSGSIIDSVKKELTGEALFIRAFSHFYLANLFGDVPLVTLSDWTKINTLPRTPSQKVYAQIIQDLLAAKALLPKDYSVSKGEHIRPTYWAATALLARAYLYTSDWKNAEANATEIIASGVYTLLPDLQSVFLANSDEAIFQLQTPDAPPYATQEGNQLIPPDGSTPMYNMTNSLLNAFEPGDKRRSTWVDSVDDGSGAGTFFYYPYKYRVQVGSPGNETEYYTVLRYAELFLIRAEAKAQQGTDLAGAIGDLNAIRERAGLPGLSTALSQSAALAAVVQERRIEFFAEWGHRWFDLKRTGQADAVLGPEKPGWVPAAKLWPIPVTEITVDHALTQNPGY